MSSKLSIGLYLLTENTEDLKVNIKANLFMKDNTE